MNLQRRHKRIRAKIIGTALRPRLCVYRSNRFLEAQVIDDSVGKTLVSGKMDDAVKLGKEIAALAKAKGISAVVFDRGGFRYTGKVAALADAARAGGLVF
jgi:large subunit ribosomal protein L18